MISCMQDIEKRNKCEKKGRKGGRGKIFFACKISEKEKSVRNRGEKEEKEGFF